jgi:hypothetical protein
MASWNATQADDCERRQCAPPPSSVRNGQAEMQVTHTARAARGPTRRIANQNAPTEAARAQRSGSAESVFS